MFEQMVLSASQYTATLFILLIAGLMFASIFYTKIDVCRK